MQDRYVGDFGDFANNGLLRVLCGTPYNPVPGMRLGIIWYRDESESEHGNEIGYLNPSNHNRRTYRACDPGLYRELQHLVSGSMERNKNRQIEDIINSNILRPDTQHYKIPIPKPAFKASKRKWLNDAIAQTAESDVIFLNPDNGIDWKGKGNRPHVQPWELKRLLEQEKILVVYQHAPHKTDWVAFNADKMRSASLAVKHLWACMWHPAPQSAYFIAAQTEQQKKIIVERLAILRDRKWVKNGHISLENV